MIKLKQRRKPEDPGDSGSLNDLSFLLIIFFLVIAGFNINKGFLLHIPEKTKPRIVQTEDLFKCELLSDGSIFFDNSIQSKEKLILAIMDKITEQPNLTFFLVIDAETPYQSVIDIIQIVRETKIDNFSFKMKEET